jgi:hypothetical protein
VGVEAGMTVRAYRWLSHADEWQGRPAHVFVDGDDRALCNRATRPATPVQSYEGDPRARSCQACLQSLENALDMQEARP